MVTFLKQQNKKTLGFTIVELVIVIAVIAVLSAIIIPIFSNIINDAKTSTIKENIRNKFVEYYIEYGDDHDYNNNVIIKYKEVNCMIYINGQVIDEIYILEDAIEKAQELLSYEVKIIPCEKYSDVLLLKKEETIDPEYNNHGDILGIQAITNVNQLKDGMAILILHQQIAYFPDFIFMGEIKENYINAEAIEVDVTGLGAMTLQVGANEGQVLDVRIPDVGIKALGIESTDVLTSDNALAAIDEVGGALAKLSSVRSRIGAYQNRLEATISSVDVTTENMTEAFSGITDVDMSEEYTAYSTNQILTQASTSVLAQANERPSQVLQLLQ